MLYIQYVCNIQPYKSSRWDSYYIKTPALFLVEVVRNIVKVLVPSSFEQKQETSAYSIFKSTIYQAFKSAWRLEGLYKSFLPGKGSPKLVKSAILALKSTSKIGSAS